MQKLINLSIMQEAVNHNLLYCWKRNINQEVWIAIKHISSI